MGPAKWKVGGLVAAAAMVMIGIGIGLAGDPPNANPVSQPLVPEAKKDVPRPVAAVPTRSVNESVYRSTNFLVTAPTPTQARIIALEAEFQRREVAKRWLGKELPNWTERCKITFVHDEKATGGSTVFDFGNGALLAPAMKLTGPFLMVVECELPHEVTHCVMATHFGKPLPRWVDEGIALQSEPAAQQASHMLEVREILNAGRALRLKHLFKMTEYPRDAAVLYAEGCSVVKYLLARELREKGKFKRSGSQSGPPIFIPVEQTPEAGVVEFVRLGMDGNSFESWDQAAKAVYGFDSVDELEAKWIEWLRDGKNTQPRPPRDEKPELIPPTKLPAR